jgi:tetratricopeptide (TPR) repeat protein
MSAWSSAVTLWWIYWGQLFRALANGLAWRGGYLWAVGCFSRALQASPGHARLYFWRGTLYWRELGDNARAEADLSQAIALAPHLARAYLNRAFVRWYGTPPDWEAASQDLRAFLARSDDPYWRRIAQEHLQQQADPGTPESVPPPPR